MPFNYYEIELKEALRPAITYAINDLKNTQNRKSDFSKTIVLPSSKQLDKLFNHIFEVNTVTLSFNPNKRLDIQYLADEELQLEGYLKLNEVKLNDLNRVEYHCQIVGRNGDLWSNIGEKELTDLQGLDTYNHLWARTVIEDSWDTQITENGVNVPFSFGKGYVYPLIEYGKDAFSSNFPTWKVEHLFPAIYVKEYIDRIFNDAGKTYQSNFFTGQRFRRLIVPFNGVNLQLTSDQIQDRVIKVDTVTQSIGNLFINPLNFTNVVLDEGSNYSAGVYTIPERGYYDISTTVDLRAVFTPSGNAVPVFINRFVKAKVGVFVNGTLYQGYNTLFLGDETVSIPVSGSYDTGSNVAFPSDAHSTNIAITGIFPSLTVTKTPNYNNPASNLKTDRNNILLSAGDTVEIKVSYEPNPSTADLFRDASGNTYGGTIAVTVESGKFISNISNSVVAENSTIDLYSAVPKDIKQKDFLKSIMNMFRLEIEPDLINPNNYIIEPFDDFYLNTTNDWSTKWDISQDLTIEPMGLLEAAEYLYTYKGDKDYYNNSYDAEFTETYGQRSGLIDNDFVKEVEKTEVIFSPTPSVQVPSVDLILPTIIKDDPNYTAIESNIRILQYSGLQTTQSVWGIESEVIGDTENYTYYPFTGHFDDPYNPTFDLNFGLPKRLYYDSSFEDVNLTNNNLFNAYHLPFLKQISQRDSKLVSGWFYLKPSDIAELSFRPLYFFNNAYFRLVKIENYDPNNPVTKCYFLKLLNTTPFTSIEEWNNGGSKEVGKDDDDGIETTEKYPVTTKSQRSNDNYGDKSTTIVGDKNYVADSAKNVTIQGDNNFVGENVIGVSLINSSDNRVLEGVTDVTLINTNNQEITESGVIYVNGKKLEGLGEGGEVLQISTSQEQSADVKAYEVNTSAADVGIDLNPNTGVEGQIWYFKKAAKQNDMILKGINGATIDGALQITFKKQFTTISVMLSNNNNFIIV